jgi:hypothetical protein
MLEGKLEDNKGCLRGRRLLHDGGVDDDRG